MRDALALFGFYLKALPHETKGLAKRYEDRHVLLFPPEKNRLELPDLF
jgi:hypothetical protein